MKLEKLFLMKIIMYLDSNDTAISFFLVNKKCGMLSSMLKINPMYDSNHIEKELQLFPMIETFRCNSMFFSKEIKLPTTIKYIHIVDKTKNEIQYEKEINKELLQHITYYETQLTKLSLLKEMSNLETLKIFCMNDKKRNSTLFSVIQPFKHLKKIIIDAGLSEPKNIVDYLLNFNTTGRKIIFICRGLEQIISKDNVIVACSYGSTEITRMLCNEYIPFQTNDFIEKSKEFTFEYGELIDRCSKDISPSYYKFVLDSLVDVKHFNTIINETLPNNICIDITKKKTSKLSLPPNINLSDQFINNSIKFISLRGSIRGKKLLDVTLPSTLQTLMVNGSSFNLLNTNSIENLLYVSAKSIQYSFPNVTKLTLRECKFKNKLDLSPFNNLLYCDLECNSTDIIFPKHELNEVYIRYKNDVSTPFLYGRYDYLKIKLDFENIKSLDVGTNLYSRKQIILPDLSCKTTLTSFQSNCYVTPGKLPTSIIKSTILVNYYNPYRQGDESIPALTNLQLLRSRSFPVDKYSTLTNLTSLVVDKHYPLDEYDLFHCRNEHVKKGIDMSMFNKLVDIDLGISVSLPILPTSVTKFIVEINTQLTPTHYSNYSYLTNLHVLSITHSPQITSLPTSLRELVIITKTKQPHDLSRLSLTKFEFGYGEKQNEYEPEFIFPTTLKDVKLEILTTNSFKIPDFRETTNLVSCSIVCNIEKDCDKFFGNMFLPNSLKTFKFVNRCFDRHTIPIEFENIDNTQLPNEEKNNFSMLMRGSQWSNYFQNPVTWML